MLTPFHIRLCLLTLFFLVFSSLYFLRHPYTLSPAAALARALYDRYPGCPKTEDEAKIDWLNSPLTYSGFEFESFESNLPPIGSPLWYHLYPNPTQIGPYPRRQWVRRLNWLKKNSTDPALLRALAIPKTKVELDGYVTYPAGIQLGNGDSGVCNWERSGCLVDAEHGYERDLDVVDSDNGTWVVSFDDGPLPPSKTLYDALDQFDAKATHFWIGGNVLKNWQLALVAAKRGDHLAVHTWSHSHLTSLSDHEVLGELGWCIQIIADVTGKVPKYFRPPYGNIDNRIRAIAKYVFGLETVIWNFDSVDWGLNQTWATGDQVDLPDPAAPSLEGVVDNIKLLASNGPRFNPSLTPSQNRQTNQAGCVILEHELSEESVAAFKISWSFVKSQGWRTVSLPEGLFEGRAAWYQ
ncbi:hypothetical protein CROQUDRAFT_652927 [Cronartium quercuum f. sp. fusiforme G11]|uniref:chitin deacetylase n=1 Tax=Cronartium quercuum f. sp. fusiforme G11 TaxID=708437 RepID=A0A9P6TFH5_9BASI|nr:hypothetical protein CROQUDRAFT_652927 [Cronartium quercuum f. sp. fusiforme G11]